MLCRQSVMPVVTILALLCGCGTEVPTLSEEPPPTTLSDGVVKAFDELDAQSFDAINTETLDPDGSTLDDTTGPDDANDLVELTPPDLAETDGAVGLPPDFIVPLGATFSQICAGALNTDFPASAKDIDTSLNEIENLNIVFHQPPGTDVEYFVLCFDNFGFGEDIDVFGSRPFALLANRVDLSKKLRARGDRGVSGAGAAPSVAHGGCSDRGSQSARSGAGGGANVGAGGAGGYVGSPAGDGGGAASVQQRILRAGGNGGTVCGGDAFEAGAGGGVILVYANEEIRVDDDIDVGGDGGRVYSDCRGGAGGGAGGTIYLNAPTINLEDDAELHAGGGGGSAGVSALGGDMSNPFCIGGLGDSYKETRGDRGEQGGAGGEPTSLSPEDPHGGNGGADDAISGANGGEGAGSFPKGGGGGGGHGAIWLVGATDIHSNVEISSKHPDVFIELPFGGVR